MKTRARTSNPPFYSTVFFLAALMIMLLSSQLKAETKAQPFVEVVKNAKPAVVHIRVEQTTSRSQNQPGTQNFEYPPFLEQFFGYQFKRQQPQQKKQGQGSGFIIDESGLILTNNHVIENANVITVQLSDGREFNAEVKGTDPQSDVALIKITTEEELPILALGNSDELEVGEWVIAIGNPFGLSQTVTVGVVSAKGRTQVGINDYENFIQTDAAINPGNSGGPLININGEVVGMNSALFSRTGGYMGIGFAIPVNMITSMKDQLFDRGSVTRGWLGVVIQDVDNKLAKSFGLEKAEGILVSEVQANSPADSYGIKAGDIIRRLNGHIVKNVSELRNKIAMVKPGTEVSFNLLRDGAVKDIAVTIGTQPSSMASAGSPDGPAVFEQFGLTLQNLTDEVAKTLGYDNRQGVLISEVKAGSPANRARLKPGYLIEEVNRNSVSNIKELRQELQNASGANYVLLKINTGKTSQYIVLDYN